jgi:hypothetical protein
MVSSWKPRTRGGISITFHKPATMHILSNPSRKGPTMRVFTWKNLYRASALAAAMFATQGCYIYSAFQGARILDQGKYSLTPSAALVNFSESTDPEISTVQLGGRGSVGIGNHLEFQVRYERNNTSFEIEDVDVDGNSVGFNYLDFGFKYGLVPDRLAVGMPIGFMFGEDVEESESLQIHPTLFLTIPASSWLDINISAKSLLFFEQLEDPLLALNGGLGIRVGDSPLTFLPETGLLFSPGDEGHYYHFGMGFTAEF